MGAMNELPFDALHLIHRILQPHEQPSFLAVSEKDPNIVIKNHAAGILSVEP